MGYRLLDHTADVGIEADGASLGEALACTALGLVAVVTGRGSAKPQGPLAEEVTFTLEAPDRPSLAVAFLSEILWILDSRGLLWAGGGADVEEEPGGPCRVVARGNAVRYDPSRHGRGVEVKAVTYHGLVAERRADGRWVLRVLLDV